MTPKFRAFANGYMFEVTELVWIDGKIKWVRGILPDGSFIGGHADYMNISEVKLMQYTGLEDRWEDDIIQFEYKSGGRKIKALGIIKYGRHLTGFNDYGGFYAMGFYVQQINQCFQQWTLFDDEIKKGIIVGNKYENPELMETHNGDNT